MLLVVDSLRACSLRSVRAPFLDTLDRETTVFRRAYATECWTLPTHLSMFTGLLPSEHGAHFQTMGYGGRAPTLAELAQAEGYETEVATRNALFDGTVPGTTRGFDVVTRLLAPLPTRGRLFHFILALAKPRVRRLLQRSGFFTAFQRAQRDFVHTVARMGIPNDRRVLEHGIERLRTAQRRGRPCFLFLNCYDVHAPYCPNETSPLRPWTSAGGVAENLRLAVAMPKVSGHGYLRPGFRLSSANRRMLRGRYETAIGLMDAKLGDFWQGLRDAGLLDDTVVVLTSDHGEAFGEHGLFLHDASVFDTHLHVPLWIHRPGVAPTAVDDLVSTRDLFAFLRAVIEGRSPAGTLVDPVYREERPVALAEHFHYPWVADALPAYRENQAAAIVGRYKLAVRGRESRFYDLRTDPDEQSPIAASAEDFADRLQADRTPPRAVFDALRHLRGWSQIMETAMPYAESALGAASP